MFNKEGKPIDVLVVEDTKINGEEVAAGTVLKQCEADLAMELASGGKVRAATKEAVAEFQRNRKMAEDAAQARKAEAEARAAESHNAQAVVVAAAVAQTLKAMGIVPSPAKA
jgi:hypothetical protein